MTSQLALVHPETGEQITVTIIERTTIRFIVGPTGTVTESNKKPLNLRRLAAKVTGVPIKKERAEKPASEEGPDPARYEDAPGRSSPQTLLSREEYAALETEEVTWRPCRYEVDFGVVAQDNLVPEAECRCAVCDEVRHMIVEAEVSELVSISRVAARIRRSLHQLPVHRFPENDDYWGLFDYRLRIYEDGGRIQFFNPRLNVNPGVQIQDEERLNRHGYLVHNAEVRWRHHLRTIAFNLRRFIVPAAEGDAQRAYWMEAWSRFQRFSDRFRTEERSSLTEYIMPNSYYTREVRPQTQRDRVYFSSVTYS